MAEIWAARSFLGPVGPETVVEVVVVARVIGGPESGLSQAACRGGSGRRPGTGPQGAP